MRLILNYIGYFDFLIHYIVCNVFKVFSLKKCLGFLFLSCFRLVRYRITGVGGKGPGAAMNVSKGGKRGGGANPKAPAVKTPGSYNFEVKLFGTFVRQTLGV
jgi:hypothetical protein